MQALLGLSRRLSTKAAPSKEARRELRKKLAHSSTKTGSRLPISKGWLGFYGTSLGIGGFTWAVVGENEWGAFIRESSGWKWILAQLGEMASPFTEPHDNKLLPDWPYLPGVPPGTPCPPTLVLDLEGTLCASTWDHKFGWRHVKRPGVEKFLKELAQLYEIVVFTSNLQGSAEPIIFALDKDGCVYYKLYREATKFHNGKHVKDLSKMNRDLRKVIIIDDDPAAYQLQPENAIHVSTYSDPKNRDASAFEDLIPFLKAVVFEGVTQTGDVRTLLRSFPDNEATTIAQEYNSKVSAVTRARRGGSQTSGLGGALRALGEMGQASRVEAAEAIVVERAPGQTVGRVSRPNEENKRRNQPLDSEHKGGLWKNLDAMKQEAEAVNRKKFEAFNEVAMRKEKEKAERATDQSSQF